MEKKRGKNRATAIRALDIDGFFILDDILGSTTETNLK